MLFSQNYNKLIFRDNNTTQLIDILQATLSITANN